MGRKIVVAMINIAVGLFTAYMFIVSDRETKISTTQSNIACEIINLDLRSGSRDITHRQTLFIKVKNTIRS